MKILALDFNSVTGWAHSDGASGIWDLKVKNDESSGMRLIRFEVKLKEVYYGPGIDLVAFESVSAGRGPKANFHVIKFSSKLQGIVERFCEEKKIHYKGYNISQIKSHATGNGKSNKDQMIAAAERKWGEIIDSNHADALWILDLAKEDLAI